MNAFEISLQQLNVLTASQIAQSPFVAKSFSDHFRHIVGDPSRTLGNTSNMMSIVAALSLNQNFNSPNESNNNNTSATHKVWNLGTAIGVIAGAGLASFLGKGSEKIAITALGAIAGSLVVNKMEEKPSTVSIPKQSLDALGQYKDPITGNMVNENTSPCIRMWTGEITPSTPLSQNPIAVNAIETAANSLVDSYELYNSTITKYETLKNEANWPSPNNPKIIPEYLFVLAKKVMEAEREYIFYKNTFLEKCDLAASQGLDIVGYQDLIPYLFLEAPSQQPYNI